MNGNGETHEKPEKVDEEAESGDEAEETTATTSLYPSPYRCLMIAATKKKKKKSKKKKTGGAGASAVKQTEPPTVGLSKLFPSGEYPLGEIREYTDEYVACSSNV